MSHPIAHFIDPSSLEFVFSGELVVEFARHHSLSDIIILLRGKYLPPEPHFHCLCLQSQFLLKFFLKNEEKIRYIQQGTSQLNRTPAPRTRPQSIRIVSLRRLYWAPQDRWSLP